MAAATAAMHDPAWYQRDAAQMQADTVALSELQSRLDRAYARWTDLE
jgi:ATP-binding cassette subfamily F protein uup